MAFYGDSGSGDMSTILGLLSLMERQREFNRSQTLEKYTTMMQTVNPGERLTPGARAQFKKTFGYDAPEDWVPKPISGGQALDLATGQYIQKGEAGLATVPEDIQPLVKTRAAVEATAQPGVKTPKAVAKGGQTSETEAEAAGIEAGGKLKAAPYNAQSIELAAMSQAAVTGGQELLAKGGLTAVGAMSPEELATFGTQFILPHGELAAESLSRETSAIFKRALTNTISSYMQDPKTMQDLEGSIRAGSGGKFGLGAALIAGATGTDQWLRPVTEVTTGTALKHVDLVNDYAKTMAAASGGTFTPDEAMGFMRMINAGKTPTDARELDRFRAFSALQTSGFQTFLSKNAQESDIFGKKMATLTDLIRTLGPTNYQGITAAGKLFKQTAAEAMVEAKYPGLKDSDPKMYVQAVEQMAQTIPDLVGNLRMFGAALPGVQAQGGIGTGVPQVNDLLNSVQLYQQMIKQGQQQPSTPIVPQAPK